MKNLKKVSAKIGAHEFNFVPPDQLQFVMRGKFRDVDAVKYLEFINAHTPEEKGLVYGAYDLTHMTQMDDAARKRVISVKQPYAFGGLAIIGASFPIRTLSNMLFRAGKIIAPQYFNYPYKFVASMGDANSWFDELRSKRV